ncbi:MAG: adventurous gliding motility lipoprotein CglD [Myxococcales bacterium]|nr:adventurous gliding motility lipoprotein CglD [Myxococcales bacterium]
MSLRLTIAAALFAGALLVTGCKPATDLNTPCRLVKRNPDGGAPLPIPEKDVAARVDANKDFLSFGTVECEDLVCVRDTGFKSDAGPDDPAFGYCSRSCAEGSSCPSQDSSLDDGPNRLRCRALLLDAETLAELTRQGLNPGNVRDPYFCARGGDGGS